jgi:DNA-directed RNA polymerase subunit omega
VATSLVEQCLNAVPSHYNLVVLAAYRAQELASGATSTVSVPGSRDSIVALTEMAEKTIDLEALENRVIRSLQHFSFLSES